MLPRTQASKEFAKIRERRERIIEKKIQNENNNGESHERKESENIGSKCQELQKQNRLHERDPNQQNS